MTQTLPIRRGWLHRAFAAILLALLLLVLIIVLQRQAAAESTADEMIKFNHQKHVAAGAQCIFCHPGVLNGPVAALPSLAKCMGCHQNVQVSGEEGQVGVEVLKKHWEEEIPLRWEKTHDQPDFVYFTHRPHIVAGVNCENCHGDVSQKTVARPAYRINMGFCLHCHRQQPTEKLSRLTACITCHH